jgi:adenylate cyclase
MIDLERENEYLLNIGGKIEKEVTMLFADIKGFSTLTEKFRLENRPAEFSAILNECLNAMSDIVYKYDGIVDKYVGDEVVAIFDETSIHNLFGNQAYRAVNAALEMQEKIFDILKSIITPIGKNNQILHVGINTGEVISGTFGSKRLKQFTVFGSEVNLAYRLMTLYEDGKIVISESTYREVKDDFEIKFLGKKRIKGIEGMIPIYEVIGHKRR